MNGKQARTLAAVVSDPVSATIPWSDIEGLLRAAGCNPIEGTGSRVRFECNGLVASFHRPHPNNAAKRYQVRDVREFLTKIGVKA